MSLDKTRKIIAYWSNAGLCSPESSTSHANPDLAFLDNIAENRMLNRCLDQWGAARGSFLDVGAGLGRFTPTMKRFSSRVILLEPAQSLFQRLSATWSTTPAVECRCETFEAFDDPGPLACVLASGVLYLYDDEMLNAFVGKVATLMATGGLFVIRDFISLPGEQHLKSSYVEGASCHYRTPDFWKAVAATHGLEWTGLVRSKPIWQVLRNSVVLRAFGRLHLTGALRAKWVTSMLVKHGAYELSSIGVQTVFIGMRKT